VKKTTSRATKAKPKAEPKEKVTKTARKAKDQPKEDVVEEEEAAKEEPKEEPKDEPKEEVKETKKSGKVEVGDTIDLDTFGGEIETNDGEKTTLKKLVDESKAGVVLFTYPKASTPGCEFPKHEYPMSTCPTNSTITRHEAGLLLPRLLRATDG
jgi:peroxiredoxin Q/BCP